MKTRRRKGNLSFPIILITLVLAIAFALSNMLYLTDDFPYLSLSPHEEVMMNDDALTRGVAQPAMPVINTAAGTFVAHFIDVGNADAILLECNGEYALIDAGENNQGNLVKEYLARQGVGELEFAVGTHPHSDHIGGLDIVLDDIPTKTVYLPDSAHTTKTYSDLLSVIEKQEINLVIPQVGDTISLGDAICTVLSPARKYDDMNDDSIVIRVVFGNTSYLFMGDATREAEEDILNSGLDLSSDVLKVGHHGSYTSSSYVFLREVMPMYTVIPCGANNDYGHPHDEVMSRLLDLQKVQGTEIYRSDSNGNIVISSDGDIISVVSEQ